MMAETDPTQPASPAAPHAATPLSSAPAARSPQEPAEPTRARPASFLGGLFGHMRQAGRDALAVALGRLLESHDPPGSPNAPGASADTAAPAEASTKRVGMLHNVAEQLRGVADTYLAAKLDEIEARVDQKLDDIEARLDRKIVELHEQLREMRDRELRHRLRVLKITLIFTVLVAALSLVYKWVARYWLA